MLIVTRPGGYDKTPVSATIKNMAEKESLEQLEQKLQNVATHVEVGARYKHYKGHDYTVLQLAILEATNEPCVVYQAEYGNKLIFVRPVSSWVEEVESEGKRIKRFEKL